MANPKFRFKRSDGSEYPDWKEKKLEDIAVLQKGKQLNKKNTKPEGLYQHLNGGVEPSGWTDEYNSEANTISISEGGANAGHVRWNKEKFFSGGHNYTLIKLDDCIIDKYLYQYLKSNETKIMSLRTGSGLPNITKTSLLNYLISVPCLEEQQQIANFFSKIDETIEATEKEIQDLELAKKGEMQKIFSQKVRFKAGDGSEYPDWRNTRFDEIFKSFPNKRYQVQKSEYKPVGEIPIIDQSQLEIAGYWDDWSKACDLLPAVIFGDHTTILKYVETPFVVGADGVKTLSTLDGFISKYAFYWLQYNNVQQRGYNRHFSKLKEVKAPSATSLDEQQEIADFLSTFDEAISAVKSELELWKKFKHGYMQRMFV